MAYSKVERSTWNDERFRSWPRDTREVWLYLMTAPHMDRPGGRIGCYVLDPMYAAADLSCPDDRWTPERVEAQLELLQDEGRILWDPAARLVLLRNFFAHNRPENPNVAAAAAKDVEELPYSETLSKALMEAVREHLPDTFEGGKPLGAAIAAAVQERMERESQKRRNGANNNPSERVVGTLPEGLPQPFPKQEQEHEQEHEHLTTTGSIDPEAGPRVSKPSKNGNRRQTEIATKRDLHALFAPLVREHLWLGSRPPREILRDDPRWDMGRELNILCGFVTSGRASAEEVAGAIGVARQVLGFDPDLPLSSRIFNVADRADRLEICIQYWRRQRPLKLQDSVEAVIAAAAGGIGG